MQMELELANMARDQDEKLTEYLDSFLLDYSAPELSLPHDMVGIYKGKISY